MSAIGYVLRTWWTLQFVTDDVVHMVATSTIMSEEGLSFVKNRSQGANLGPIKPDRSSGQWHFGIVDHGLDVGGVVVGLLLDEPKQGVAKFSL